MKLPLLFLATLFTINLSSQNLQYDQGFKFDVESGFYYNDENLEDVLFINHTDSLVDYDTLWQPDSSSLSSLFVEDGSELTQVAAFAADCGIAAQAIGTNTNGSVLIIGDTECSYEFRNIEEISGPFTIPNEDYTAIYLFYDGPDREEGAALLTSNNSIQRAGGTDDYLLMTGHTSDTLGYFDIDGQYTSIDLQYENSGYIIAVDEQGKMAWHYENESETSLSFIRTVAYIDQKIYVAHHQIFKTDILVFSEEGALLEEHTWGGVTVYNITSDGDGNIYFSGNYDTDGGNGNISFGDQEILLPEPDAIDAFIAKYDSDLNYLWSQTITGGNIDTGVHCDVDNDGDIFLTGCIQQDGIFDKGGPSEVTFNASGLEDVFLAKYSSDGRLLYANTMGGTSADIGLRLSAENGEVRLWGLFRNTIDLVLDEDFSALFTDENDELDESYFYVIYSDFTISNTDDGVGKTKGIQLYPNPASDRLNIAKIETLPSETYAIISDISGKTIAHYPRVPNSIDVSNLSGSIYTLHIYSSSGLLHSERFVVVR